MPRYSNSIPDPEIAAVLPKVRARIGARSQTLSGNPNDFDQLVDESLRKLFQTHLNAVDASEGTIWVVDPEAECLVPMYNTGPDAETLVESYRQPLDRGIISMVLATQRGISENMVSTNSAHDSSVDKLLGNVTAHMIALPWFIDGEPAGVVSAVKMKTSDKDEDPPSFDSISFRTMGDFASLLGELVGARLLRGVLGDT